MLAMTDLKKNVFQVEIMEIISIFSAVDGCQRNDDSGAVVCL